MKELKGYGRNISSIDFVKEIAKKCGWDETKTKKNRKFLSDLKKLLIEWNNVPFERVNEQIFSFDNFLRINYMNERQGVVFVACREAEEIEKFVNNGAITVCIRRKEAENVETSNSSDDQVLNYKYDYYVDNNGDLKDLQKAAKQFLMLIKDDLNF